jgi:hypothetical protein
MAAFMSSTLGSFEAPEENAPKPKPAAAHNDIPVPFKPFTISALNGFLSNKSTPSKEVTLY